MASDMFAGITIDGIDYPVVPLIIATPTIVVANMVESTTAVFSVADSIKGAFNYQWQYKAPNRTAWANTTISGNKTNTLSVPISTGRNGYQYRCKITAGTNFEMYSNPCLLVAPFIAEDVPDTPPEMLMLDDEG